MQDNRRLKDMLKKTLRLRKGAGWWETLKRLEYEKYEQTE